MGAAGGGSGGVLVHPFIPDGMLFESVDKNRASAGAEEPATAASVGASAAEDSSVAPKAMKLGNPREVRASAYIATRSEPLIGHSASLSAVVCVDGRL